MGNDGSPEAGVPILARLWIVPPSRCQTTPLAQINATVRFAR